MTGFTTDYVNLIADNLRDRYKSGFPILKELVQNADDAGAQTLAFGYHAGHGATADHLLLKGPALWVLNDGKFKESDRRAIRSFGLNAKAGDSGAIGKFGLGMKSVFHLCESFLYLASDHGTLTRDVLNPWKAEDCSDFHRSWETVTDRDKGCLETVARAQPEASGNSDWFLLWVPLRLHSHVPRSDGRPVAAIIERYPGENPDNDLDFFSDPNSDQRIGGLLPLLKNLKQVRFAGAQMRQPFKVTLETQPPEQRLDHKTDNVQITGAVADDRPHAEHLRFLVRQRVLGEVSPFRELRAAESWASATVIVESGTRESRPDKATAEAAVMFSHANNRKGRLILQWAVFLPTEEQHFSYEAPIPGSSQEFRIVLHGQFFVDAGRRGIAHSEALGTPCEALPERPSQDVVLRHWNQSLAQQVVLPELLPGLSAYVQSAGLKDSEIDALTRAIQVCAAAGDAGAGIAFYRTFQQFICERFAWIRRLSKSGPRWELIEPAIVGVLPLPAPPSNDAERPWRALPGLAALSKYAFADVAAPKLSNGYASWTPELLISALKGVDAHILKSETHLEYLARFLEMEADRSVRTGEVQDALVDLLRACLQAVRLSDVRQHRKIFRCIVQCLEPGRIFTFGPKDHAAKGAIPEALYRTILSAATRALPVPGDLGPDGVTPLASEADLQPWLHAIAQHDLTGSHSGRVTKTQLLDASDRVIQAAGDEKAQLTLLRQCSRLKVLRAYNGTDGEIEAVSLDELITSHRCGWVFKVTDPNRRMGLVQKLARALPEIRAFVIGARVPSYVEGKLPGSQDDEALLRVVGANNDPPRLGNTEQRAELLSLVATAKLEDPLVIRGVRYLLHGSADHYRGDDVLWKDPVGQKSPWVRLWRMIDEAPWRVLADSLCGSIPDKCAQSLNIKAVDETSVLRRLRECNDFSRIDASQFTSEEIDLLLGRVTEESSWKRLPLHQCFSGDLTAVQGDCYLGRDPQLPEGLIVDIRFIKPSNNPDHSRHQKDFLRSWDATTATAVVLKAPNPVQHWRYLMGLLRDHPDLGKRPPLEWNEKAWLPLQSGGAIALDSLIRIDHLTAEIRDLARRCDFAYASPDDLAAELRNHPAFETLEAQVSSGEKALPVLGQLMSEAGLSIGWAAGAGYRDLQKHMQTLVSIAPLPAWGILERATAATSPEAVEQHLVPKVAKQLSESICRQVLIDISKLSPDGAVGKVFGVYLREWRASADDSELRAALEKLTLLSKARTWVPAANLVAGVHGVVPEDVIDDDCLECLSGIAVDNRSTPTLEPTEVPVDDPEATPEQLRQSLEEYFEPLISSSVKLAVGAVIGLCGKQVASLAKSWLDPIAYEDYLAKLGWKDPGYEEGTERRLKWMGNKTLEEALGTLTIRLAVLRGEDVSATSLTGAAVEVRMASVDDLQTLFVKSDSWQRSYGRVLMRPAEMLIGKEPQQQRDILMRTGESLLRDLYNQPHANLSELFALADEADQVTLDVARSLILDGLAHSLRSLPGIQKNEKVAKALARLDEARRDAASGKRAGRSKTDAAAKLELARRDLAALVESDHEVQAAVLDGIRARVQHNQYEVASIPFELFQNADDAVVEMQDLQQADGRPAFDEEDIGRFVMRASDRTIRFAHWGRPINHAGRLASRKSEFANDLERMLMLGASAKDGEEGVTGKFGLGFKSVLLASSTPRVWSGDLCFEVVAGCLPRKWTVSEETRTFQKTAQTPSQRTLRETVVELPLDSVIDARKVMERFAGLAGLLPVFARKLRCVVVDEESHTWQPHTHPLDSGREIETGSVTLPIKGGRIRSRILVFRTSSGCVVLRVGAGGVEEFDRDAQPAVPATWVTAPTRGTPAHGVLLNAPFQIDTGRAALALGESAAQNTALVEKLADEVASVLIDLQTESESNWSVLADRLGCSQSISPAGFWFGLWEKLLGKPPGQDSAKDVHLTDTFARRVFSQVVKRTGRVPNGLTGDDTAFVDVERLCLSVSQSYLASVIPALRKWKRFVDKFPLEGWCADQVREWLKRAELVEDEGIPTLGPAQIVGLFDGHQLPATEVPSLAEVIRAWPSNRGEPDRRRCEIASLLLCSNAGTWVPATALIRGCDQEADLLRRFAPEGAVLHRDYEADSQAFRIVEQYLPDWSNDPSMLAGWCMSAAGEEAQSAVAKWLKREINGPVIEHVRGWRHRGGWLFELREDSPALAGLSPEWRQLLLTELGQAATDEEVIPDVSPSPGLSPNLDLISIYGWWAENSKKWLAEFDRNFWPESVDRSALKEEEPYDRNAWMTLFSLGLFRRYGRVTDQQHRGFIDFLDSKGWWQTICEVPPDIGAEAWMDILRAYGEQQQTGTIFEQWMDSFPRLYRIARWLNDYVHLFQTLDHRDSKSAKELLSPAMDPSLSGSGIEAPTLSGMLRLGQHLVIRELLRSEVLSSETARELAFAPRRAVLDLMAQLGHADLKSGSDIYQALVRELGEEDACFSGAYDIPLQLIATNESARHEAEQWAENGAYMEPDDASELE